MGMSDLAKALRRCCHCWRLAKKGEVVRAQLTNDLQPRAGRPTTAAGRAEIDFDRGRGGRKIEVIGFLDLAFQLKRFDCGFPEDPTQPRELWPPERLFHDVLAGDKNARYFGRLTVDECIGKTVAEIVRSKEGGA